MQTCFLSIISDSSSESAGFIYDSLRRQKGPRHFLWHAISDAILWLHSEADTVCASSNSTGLP